MIFVKRLLLCAGRKKSRHRNETTCQHKSEEEEEEKKPQQQSENLFAPSANNSADNFHFVGVFHICWRFGKRAH